MNTYKSWPKAKNQFRLTNLYHLFSNIYASTCLYIYIYIYIKQISSQMVLNLAFRFLSFHTLVLYMCFRVYVFFRRSIIVRVIVDVFIEIVLIGM